MGGLSRKCLLCPDSDADENQLDNKGHAGRRHRCLEVSSVGRYVRLHYRSPRCLHNSHLAYSRQHDTELDVISVVQETPSLYAHKPPSGSKFSPSSLSRVVKTKFCALSSKAPDCFKVSRPTPGQLIFGTDVDLIPSVTDSLNQNIPELILPPNNST